MKVLLIESDDAIVVALVKRLTAHHVVVDVVKNEEDGWTYGSTFGYDLIVVGGESHHINGVGLCERFREEGLTLPILLIMAQNTNVGLVHALDAGADDCIVGSFEMDELHARIRALLRRGRANPFPVIVWGDLVLNSSTCEVTYREQPIVLTAKEYSLLELFLRDTQHVFSIEEILDSLWSSEEFPSEATVRSHLRRLRRKLQEAGATSDFIATVHGRGYYIKATDGEANGVANRGGEFQAQQNGSQTNGFLSRPSASPVSPIAEKEQGEDSLSFEWTSKWSQSETDDTQSSQAPILLILSRNEAFAHAIAAAAVTQGIRVAIASSLEQAKPWLVPNAMRPFPDAILIQTPVRIKAVQALVRERDVSVSSDCEHETSLAESKTSANLERTLDTLRLMGEHHLSIPIAVMSHAATWSDRLLASRRGSTLFLSEPITPNQVVVALLPMLRVKGDSTKVLTLDSDPAWLQAMLTLLTPWGFEVITLDDVEPLMDVLDSVNPEVILLDAHLSTVDGIELCRLLRHDPKWRHLSIFVLSETADPLLQERAFVSGADDYLTKPIQGKELAERIMARLRRLQFVAATSG